MVRSIKLAVACLLATAFASTGSSLALDRSTGEADYRNSCASCHGVRGRGDGFMAEVLTRKPADLTVLERNNHGRFPLERVLATIDGRFIVPGHGERAMPIWGNVFRQEGNKTVGPNGVEISAQDRILALAEYIRSLQHQ